METELGCGVVDDKQFGAADHSRDSGLSPRWARCGSALLMIAGVACGRVSVNAGGDGGMSPPDDASQADASPADAINPFDDTDGDLVPDIVDNCKTTANLTQDNEDGDRFGDACDPCPPFTDLDPVADGDGDGVSDLCDPFPARSGDKIERFEGFAFPFPPGGAEITGDWAFAGSVAMSFSSPDEVSAITWEIPGGGRLTVAAKAEIVEMFGRDVARPVGVVQQFRDGRPAGPIDGLVCVFGINPSNNEVFAIADNARTEALDDEAADANVGSTSTFFLTRPDTTSYRCNGSAVTSPLMASSPLSFNPNKVGIFTRSASADFDWAMIISSR
jgi:hypothetical protein